MNEGITVIVKSDLELIEDLLKCCKKSQRKLMLTSIKKNKDFRCRKLIRNIKEIYGDIDVPVFLIITKKSENVEFVLQTGYDSEGSKNGEIKQNIFSATFPAKPDIYNLL